MIYQSISQNKPKYLSFKRACQCLSVSPSGYFKSLKQSFTLRGSHLLGKEVVRAFHSHRGFYGYRKLSRSLLKEGFFCSTDQARRILRNSGLRARTSRSFRPRTTQSRSGQLFSQRLFKTGETVVTAVDQVYGSDITYLRALGGNFLYLVVFMDFYSRRIVGWELSHTLSSDFVLRAFDKVLMTRSVSKGLIIHSDRGVQYTCRDFRKKLENLGFIQSMSRKGNCYDNAYCESFFSLLKRELGDKVYQNLEAARKVIFEWIEGWYNTHRIHSALNYESPLEFENKMEITP